MNPFPASTYYGAEYFCDRENETKILLENILNGNSTTIVSIRRIGKTGLIHHTLANLPANYKGIYIDILETENLSGFLNSLVTAIMQNIPENNKIGKIIWTFLKSMRPVITYDPLSGTPQASFELKPKEVEKNIDSLLTFLDSQQQNVVIAIDEFQQICNYPENNTDAWLRTRIQTLKNIVFIFSGSQQHIMTELFASPSRPFYRSTMMMRLEKLNKSVYADFIIKMFEKHKKKISPDIVEQILNWTDIHTFYTQQFCNKLFSASTDVVAPNLWKEIAVNILKEQELLFYSYRNMLTSKQWNLLKGIAKEDIVLHPTGQEFIKKYNLGSSASVTKALSALSKYELIYSDFTSEGEKYYSVYDVYFKRWSVR